MGNISFFRLYFLVFFLLFSSFASVLAQARVVLVWDQAKKTFATPLKEVNLIEGMYLEAEEKIALEEGHELILLTENHQRISLSGPKRYTIPKVSWKEAGEIKMLGENENSRFPLQSKMLFPQGSTLLVNKDYRIWLQTPKKSDLLLTGPTQFTFNEKGYQLGSFKKGILQVLDRNTTLEKLTNLEGALLLRRASLRPIYPILPRKWIRPQKKIRFSWTSFHPKSQYVLRIWVRENKKRIILFEEKTEQTSLEVEIPTLDKFSKFYWGIGILDENQEEQGLEASQDCQYWIKVKFISKEVLKTLLPQEEVLLQKIKQNPRVLIHWIELLLLYYEAQLYGEALTILSQIAKEFEGRYTRLFPLMYSIALEELKINQASILSEGFQLNIYKIILECIEKPSSKASDLLVLLEKLSFDRKSLAEFSKAEQERYEKLLNQWNYFK